MTPRVTIPPSQLFPVPQETPEACLHTFEEFTSDQLDYVAGSNEGLDDSRDPVVHLLSYKEDAILSLAREKDLLAPNPANGMFYAAQRYRAGVCIGATIVRTRIDECERAGKPLPEMHVDPGRRYLGYPEEKTGDNFMRYYGEMLTGRLEDAYLLPAVRRQYFAREQSVADVHALERAWINRGMDFLLRGRVSAEEMFGEVCRGMFHAFRLYRMLERESHLASWEDTVYNPARHQRLDPLSQLASVHGYDLPGLHDAGDSYESAAAAARGYRRWLGGIKAKGPREGLLGKAASFEYLGDTILVPDTKIERARRCLTGFVQASPQPNDEFLHVAYRSSIEDYKVQADDTLVVRSNDHSHYTMYGSERVQQPGELVALCRGNEAIMFSDLHGRPLDESLMHTLTMQLAANAYA